MNDFIYKNKTSEPDIVKMNCEQCGIIFNENLMICKNCQPERLEFCKKNKSGFNEGKLQ
jgi:uncharacterized OB-fold protein